MTKPTRANDGERLALTDHDLAGLLGVSRSHVWSMNSRGKLPAPIRLGRSVRWARAEVEDWLAADAPPRDEWERVR